MSTVAWLIIGLLLLALLFRGAARASSASIGSDVRQGASNNRPVVVAQAEVAARGASIQRYEVGVRKGNEPTVSESLSETQEPI